MTPFAVEMQLVKTNNYKDAFDQFSYRILHDRQLLHDVFITLTKASIRDYTNANLSMLIAKLYYANGLYEDALDESLVVLELNPSHPEIYLLLSKFYDKTPHQDLICSLFESAHHAEIQDPIIVSFLPQIYLNLDKTDAHIAFYQRQLDATPTTTSLYKPLAQLHEKNGDFLAAGQLYFELVSHSPIVVTDSIQSLTICRDKLPDCLQIRNWLVELYYQSLHPLHAHRELQDMSRLDTCDLADIARWYTFGLDRFPDTPILSEGLATAYRAQGHYAQAVVAIESLVENAVYPNDRIIRFAEEILDEYPDQQMARFLIIKLAIAQPDFELACHHLEYCIAHHGDQLNDSLAYLSQLLSQNPQHPRALYLQAAAFVKLGEPDSALPYLSALTKTAYQLEGLQLEVEIYINQDRYKRAIHRLHDGLATQPYHHKLHHALRDVMHLVLAHQLRLVQSKTTRPARTYQLGLLALRKGQFLNAISQFQSIQSIDKFSTKTTLLIARAFMELGRFDLAIDQFHRVLSEATDHTYTQTHSRFLLGLCYIHCGQLVQAQHTFNHILQQDLSFHGLQPLLAHLASRQLSEHFPRLMICCDDWIGDTPTMLVIEPTLIQTKPVALNFSVSHNNQGLQFLMQQNITSATHEFQMAAQLDPMLEVAHLNLAMCALIQDDFDAASHHLDNAKTINDTFDGLHLMTGMMHYRQANFSAAIQAFEAALACCPNSSLAALCLGDCYYRQDDMAQAWSFWTQASADSSLFFLINRRTRHLLDRSLGFQYWLCEHTPYLG